MRPKTLDHVDAIEKIVNGKHRSAEGNMHANRTSGKLQMESDAGGYARQCQIADNKTVRGKQTKRKILMQY